MNHVRRGGITGEALRILLAVLAGIVIVGNAHSAEPVLQFSTPERAALYDELTREFRCLKCQNQNLADSNAGLASDLRNEIQQQVEAGQGRDEIAAYLVARYGEFVLYRPPFKRSTWALWIGPFILLLVGVGYAYVLIRRHRREAEHVVADKQSAEFQRIARDLLDEPSNMRDSAP